MAGSDLPWHPGAEAVGSGLMLILLTILTLYSPHRVEVSAVVSGAAWGFPPHILMGLADTESTLQHNPPRNGPDGRRWGPPPMGRRWRYCGLMQLRGGAQPMGQPPEVLFPPCEILILFPELSVRYGAMHLDGWRRSYGMPWALEAYNCGCLDNDRCLESDGSFMRKVLRKARRWE